MSGPCCGDLCIGCPIGDRNRLGLAKDIQDECQHQWLDRPESDTAECLLCGLEV